MSSLTLPDGRLAVLIRWIRRWSVDLIVIVIYTLLTIAMTWPLVLHMDSHFAGQNIDVWINQWATWWTEKAISEGQSLYYTDLMFYPQGVSLAFHSFSHVNTLLVLLLRPWLGDLGAHNATVLIAHALSGYAMFCLVRHLARSFAGAFFAGLVFAFFPYRLAESVHPVLVSTQWMPFYFLFLIRLVEKGNRRYVIPAALFFVLTALTSWHLMLFTTLLSAIYLCHLVAAERWYCSKATVLNLMLLAGLSSVIIAPFIFPLVREQLTVSRTYVEADAALGKGNDLVAFLLPAEQHPILGRLVIPAHAHIKNIRAAYLGITVLGLGVVGSLKNWIRARYWVLVVLLSVLFSVEPNIQIGGYVLNVTAPWSMPIVQLFRHPFRFNLLIGLALAVTSGLGFSAVLHWLIATRPGWRWPFVGAIMALLLFEYLYFPFPTTPAFVPDYYLGLSSVPGEKAILELPMGRVPSRYYLYYQMTHGRPLVEGVVSRTPHEAYTFIEATPTLRSLRACGSYALPPANLSLILNVLAEQGIDYVILHKRLVRQTSLDLWLDTRAVAPDDEDEHIAVYSTRREPSGLAGEAQLLEACVAVRSLSTDPVSLLPGDTVEIPLEWIIGNPPQEAHILELALVDETKEAKRRHYYKVMPGAPLTAWHTGKRHATSYPLSVDPLVPPGIYHLRATLVPVKRDREHLLSANLLDVQVLTSSERYTPPALEKREVNAVYGSELRLLRYDLEVGDDAVHIVLHWQSLRQIETDYKFFLHLYDAQSQVLAAQVDTMPHDWTYPTTWWEAGKVVSDEITLSLKDVPPGTYQMGIGVYNYHTGERLTITGQPARVDNDKSLLFLPEEVVRSRRP